MKPIYLSISECPPKRTVYRYKTWDEVQAAKNLLTNVDAVVNVSVLNIIAFMFECLQAENRKENLNENVLH